MEYTDLFNINQFKKFKREIEHYNDFMSYNQSTAILKNSISCFPCHPGLYYLLALTYYKSNEHLKANKYFEKGISFDEKSNQYLGLISAFLFEINDLENSYSYASKALEVDNSNMDAIVTLGRIELIRNNYEESLSYGVKAIELDENSFRAVRLLSKIYIAMGVDENDTLRILYRAKELGYDLEIELDIIKILYLTEKYILCLKQCKNAMLNHCTGYVSEKINKYVCDICSIAEKSTASIQVQQSEVALTRECSNDDLTENYNDNINDKKTNFRNRFVDNVDNIIKLLENKEILEEKIDNDENAIDMDYEEKNNSEEDFIDYNKVEDFHKKNQKDNSSNKNDNEESSDNNNLDDNISKNENINSDDIHEKIDKDISTRKRRAKEEIKRNSNSLEEALNKLNSLIGLKNVKSEIEKIVNLIKYEKNRSEVLGIEKPLNLAYNFAFMGNPGTGKTTVARLIGDIFYYLGILKKGHVVEVDRSDIVGRFIGETAKLTKKAIDKAMDGILFVDEAYSLAKGGENSNDYGSEAVETILKAMEDNRGHLTVIFAGYTKEMRNLLNLNPGLQSRINLQIIFEDYEDEELCDIAKSIAVNEHYNFTEDGEKAFIEKINIQKVDENFANARCARNILEDAIREKAFRIGDNDVSKEELTTLNAEDFGVNLEFTARDSVKENIEELDSLVGLNEVKEIVKNILNTLELQHRKKDMGIACNDISLNMIFSGNPGTGKTTVARIMGRILKSMGILKKGHMVEVTRSDLVGQYVGQTGPKTLVKIKEAYGGILFIDEAYSLNGQGDNDFGKEAIATLIKEMEDNRDKLIVIMAGYTKEMKELINLNPGFESRIKFNIEFKDYDGEELFKIFKTLCKYEKYKISHNAYKKLKEDFEEISNNKDRNFGNGRLVRKYFEDVKMKQATRIINENIIEKDELLKIIREDVL